MTSNSLKNEKRLIIAALVLPALLLPRCTSGPLAGNTVETGNARVAGVIRDTENRAVSNAVVHLVPTTYDPRADTPATLAVDTTSDDGGYVLYAPAGTYNLIAQNPSNHTSAMQPAVEVSDSSDVSVPAVILKKPGAATVALDSSLITQPGVLSIPGTFVTVEVTAADLASGAVVIDGLPAAVMPQVRYGASGSAAGADMLVATGFSVSEGVTVFAPSGSLPSPWLAASIGETPAGGAVYRDSQFLVLGGGPDIWNDRDGFHFVHQALSGDWDMIVRLDSMPPTERYARAGIMARSSLDPQSANVMVSIDHVPPMWGVIHHRPGFADTTTAIHRLLNETPAGFDYGPPVWLRLTRAGDLFTGYVSRDRNQWYRIGYVTVPLGTEILLGLAVTSHSEQVVHTGVFENVAIQ